MANVWEAPERPLRDGPQKVKITYHYPDEDEAFAFLQQMAKLKEAKEQPKPGDALDSEGKTQPAPSEVYSLEEIQLRSQMARQLAEKVTVDGVEVPGDAEAAQKHMKSDARFIHLLVADAGWLFRLSPNAGSK